MRNTRWYHAATVAAAIVLSGCQAQRVGLQGTHFREALLGMYTAQILDNLIRAYHDLPFVQLEFTDLFVQDVGVLGTDASMGDTVTNERSVTFSGASSRTVGRTVASPWEWNAEFKRTGTMYFHAKPITDRNQIYDAYVAFAKDPDLFVAEKGTRSPSKPHHPGTEHTQDGWCYYVPKSAAREFLELALLTTFKHGAHVAPGYYQVKIKGVGELTKTPGRPSVKGTLEFDTPVPNGNALMMLTHPETGQSVRIPLYQLERLEGGAPTTKLEAEWSPEKRGIRPDQLRPGLAVRIYSEQYPPEPPRFMQKLESIETTLRTIQSNQIGP